MSRGTNWWIAAGLVCWLAATNAERARALEIAPAQGDSLCLEAHLSWTEAVPAFIADRLDRGIPSTLSVQIELWRVRAGWFDAHVETWERDYYLLRDPLSGAYRVRSEEGVATMDSLGAVRAYFAAEEVRLPVREPWCDERSIYRLAVAGVIRPLTAEDLGELEDWLGGETRARNGGVLGLPTGMFRVVRDLSGLGERRFSGESGRFRMRLEAGAGVSVIPISAISE